jgi:hypothetical protein
MVMMMEIMVAGNKIEKSKFDGTMDEGWGMKSSPKEKSDSSMKIDEVVAFKNRRQMSLISCFCFTILTINPIIIGVKIVF